MTGESRVSEAGKPAAAAQTTRAALNETGARPPCTLRARSSAPDTTTVTVSCVRRQKLTHQRLRVSQQSMVRSYSDVLSRTGGQHANRLPTRCATCPPTPDLNHTSTVVFSYAKLQDNLFRFHLLDTTFCDPSLAWVPRTRPPEPLFTARAENGPEATSHIALLCPPHSTPETHHIENGFVVLGRGNLGFLLAESATYKWG